MNPERVTEWAVTEPGTKNPETTGRNAPDRRIAPDAPDCLGGVHDAEFNAALDAVRAHFARYVVTGSDGDLDLLALWTAHTYLCIETYTSPRLILDSPVPGSGKTTVLEHIEHLGYRPVQMSSVSSPALLTRMLDDGMRTILIDEVDRSLSPNKPGIEDIMAVLNSGYKRGASRPVLQPDKEKGWVAKEMPTYSPVVMAGNAPQLPDDTRSRALTVLLMPAGEDEVEETDWELIEIDVDDLRERLDAAAEGVRDEVRQRRPAVPKGCMGRMKERWLPLKRVAAAASDDWAARVDALILRDLEDTAADREAGIAREPVHVTMLKDVAELFRDYSGHEFMASEVMVAELIERNPSYWSEHSAYGKRLTSKRMGQILKRHFQISSDRQGRSEPRGYYRLGFERAWAALRVDVPTRRAGSTAEQPALSTNPAHPAQSGDPARFDRGNTAHGDGSGGYCLRYGCTNLSDPDADQCAEHLTESETAA